MREKERLLADYQCQICGLLFYCPDHGFRYKKPIKRKEIKNIGKWVKRRIKITEPWVEEVMEDGLPKVAPSVAESEARKIWRRGETPRIVEGVISKANESEKKFQCPKCERWYYCHEHGFNIGKYIKKESPWRAIKRKG